MHAKGNGPGHDRFAETQEARITLFAGATLANGDRRAEFLESVHNNRPGLRRDEHVDRPIRRPCNHGGRQRGVATGSDRQAAMPQAFSDRQACRRNHTQIQHDAHQMPGLMRTGDITGFILDPQCSGQTQRARQCGLRCHRCQPEPSAVNDLQRLIKAFDDLRPGLIGQPDTARKSIRGQKLAIPEIRIVAIGNDFGRPGILRHQHMVDVIACHRTGTAKRQKQGCIDLRTAPVADELPGNAIHRPNALPAPVRALNSAIMASQAGTSACRSSQNDCLERAVNSSSETPCCSTQVK